MAAVVIPPVPLGPTDNVPLIGQGEPLFSSNAQISLTYQAQLPTDLNVSIEQMNALAQNLNDALTITEINNDSELFSLPPNAPVKIVGLRANPLVGALIDTADIASRRGAILHESVTGGVWFYSVGTTFPTGFHGQLVNLTDTPAGSQIFGGYVERIASSVVNIDASQYNKVTATHTGAVVISFANIATLSYTCVIDVTDGDGTLSLSLPANTSTAGGVAPTYTASGRDKIILKTEDQGASWDMQITNDWKVIA